MDPNATGIFSQIAQQGEAFGIMILIIIALIYERKRLISDLKELSNMMNETLRDNGEKYYDVVSKNTEAFTSLKETINVIKNNHRD